MKKILLSFFIIISFSPASLAADIRAFVDRTSIAPSESVRLTVSSKDGDAAVDLSPIKDFKVLSQGTSSSVQITNGNVSREMSYNYTLFPLKTGRLTIPALVVTVNGERHTTQAIAINVSHQSTEKDTSADIFVEADISNKTPYEGQQIIYTFKLFHLTQIANAKFQTPTFAGFTAKEVGDQTTYASIINGKQYTVSELAYVLIPLNSGEKTIDPAILECDVVKQKQRRRNTFFDSFFDDPFFGSRELEPRIFRTDPLTIQVKPLPAYKENVKFSGLVGEFTIAEEIENDTLNVGDSTTLSLTIQGEGNIMDVEAPEINVPDAFKIYKDNPEENIQLSKNGYSGKKIFRTALVPVEAGDFLLSPVRFSYFDVSSNKYKILTAKPISLTVAPAQEKETLSVFSPQMQQQPALKNKVKFIGRDILPLNESLDALNSEAQLSLSVFVLYLLAPVILYLGTLGIIRAFQGDDDPAILMRQRAEKSLKMARQLKESASSDTDEAFFSHLYRALISIILSKTGSVGESLTYTEAKSILLDDGCSNETAVEASQLLEKIESAKFSGIGKDISGKSELYTETETLIKQLTKR